MRVLLLVDIDGSYDQCEETLDQLEEIVEENAALHLGYGHFASVVHVQEAPELDAKEAH